VHFLGDVLLNLAGWANFRDLVAGFSPLFSSVDDPIDSDWLSPLLGLMRNSKT
jgi:hypothetical protein